MTDQEAREYMKNVTVAPDDLTIGKSHYELSGTFVNAQDAKEEFEFVGGPMQPARKFKYANGWAVYTKRRY